MNTPVHLSHGVLEEVCLGNRPVEVCMANRWAEECMVNQRAEGCMVSPLAPMEECRVGLEWLQPEAWHQGACLGVLLSQSRG